MRITRVFLDVDMRQNFEGLRSVAEEAKAQMGEASCLLFMNRKATCFKMLVGNEYVIYYKNGNKRIPLDAIQYLPKSFGGTETEMNQAIRKSLGVKLNIDQHKD